jgi:hypothetical protein
MFKRMIVSCLAALASVAFVGCGDEPQGGSSGSGSSAPSVQVSYKCDGCSATKTAGAADAAPSC